MKDAIEYLEKKVKEFDDLAELADKEGKSVDYFQLAHNATALEYAIKILKEKE